MSSPRRRSQEGFTVIELIVVIAIILIISAILLVALNTARQRSRDSRREADVNALRSAQNDCRDDVACGGGAGLYAPDQEALVDAGFLRAVVMDPASGDAYFANGFAPGQLHAEQGPPASWSVCASLEAQDGIFVCTEDGCVSEESGTCEAAKE